MLQNKIKPHFLHHYVKFGFRMFHFKVLSALESQLIYLA